jgi:threonylcarbamoyladenosine tRNA methylthiotransferase CDKAL1
MTLDLVKQYKFSSLFINQFFQRPGTPAARMNQVPTQERKRRTKELSDLFHSYTTYDHKLGTRCHVLVTETSHDQEHYVAHNKFYEQVLVPKNDALIGKMVEVEIIHCEKFSMKGRVIEESIKAPQRYVEISKGKVTGLETLKNRENNAEQSCCGSCDRDSDETNQQAQSCCSSSDEPNADHYDLQKKSNLRNYAFATLIATSAILLSRIALKIFYSNK